MALLDRKQFPVDGKQYGGHLQEKWPARRNHILPPSGDGGKLTLTGGGCGVGMFGFCLIFFLQETLLLSIL